MGIKGSVLGIAKSQRRKTQLHGCDAAYHNYAVVPTVEGDKRPGSPPRKGEPSRRGWIPTSALMSWFQSPQTALLTGLEPENIAAAWPVLVTLPPQVTAR